MAEYGLFKQALRYWVPSIIIGIVIFLLSSKSQVSVTKEYVTDFAILKTLHMIEYAILYISNYRAAINTVAKANKKEARRIAFLLTFLYATTDELHQLFVPTRTGKLRDILIDTTGIMIALVGIWKLLPKAPLKLKYLAAKLEIT